MLVLKCTVGTKFLQVLGSYTLNAVKASKNHRPGSAGQKTTRTVFVDAAPQCGWTNTVECQKWSCDRPIARRKSVGELLLISEEHNYKKIARGPTKVDRIRLKLVKFILL